MVVPLLPQMLWVEPLNGHVGVGLQVLGLGGKMMLDYEPDTRAPHLNLFEDDYLDFDGACMGGGVSVGWRTVGRREERG